MTRFAPASAVLVSLLIALSPLLMFEAQGTPAHPATRQVTLIVDPAGSDGFKMIGWALKNATDGDTVLIYPGTYRESVVIDKELKMTGSGSRQTFIVATGAEAGVLVSSGGVRISGLNVSGAFAGIEVAAGGVQLTDCTVQGNVIGLNLTNADNCTFKSCSGSGNSGAGCALNGSYDNAFSNCHFDGNWQFGAYLYNSSRNSFVSCAASYNLGFGAYLDSGSHDSVVEGCSFDANGYDGLAISSSDRAYVGNSTCLANGAIGLLLSDVKDAEVFAVSADGNGGAGIYMNGSTGNSLVSCSSDYNGKYGMHLWMSDGNTFRGGSASGNDGWGIYLYWFSDRDVFMGYNCSDNAETGIYLGDADKAEVLDCVCSGNGVSGIYMRTNGTRVKDCTVSGNGQYGMHLYYSDGSAISGCTVERSGATGIYAYQSGNNVISSNVMSENPVGLKFKSGSDGNTVFGNVIISPWMGLPLAVDDGKNSWSWPAVGPGTGNYWSGYASSDADGNGVYDTPYAVNGSGGAVDRCPSVGPFGYPRPIAVAGADATVVNGTAVLLNASLSYAPSGISNYTWECGAGGSPVLLYGPLARLKTTQAGNLTVVLTVRDAGGNASSARVVVHVLPGAAPGGEGGSGDGPEVRPLMLQVLFLAITVASAFLYGAARKGRRKA